jgi:ParB-like chromosome segregation protein Spo0J
MAQLAAIEGGALNPHRFALAMPKMRDADYADLRKDIAEHGQRVPIVLYQGHILDGVHRYRACGDLGLTPVSEAFDGDDLAALALVVSLNIRRRHMSKDMLAALGVAELLDEEKRKAAERMNEGRPSAEVGTGSKAVEVVAKAVGVGKGKVQEAAKLKDEDLTLFQQVAEGRTTLAAASAERAEERAQADPEYAQVRARQQEDAALSRVADRIRGLATADLDAAQPGLARLQADKADSYRGWICTARTVLDRVQASLDAHQTVRRIR